MNEPAARLERDGFVARAARSADIPQIAEVLTAAFPRWPAIDIDCSVTEHVEWKMASPGTPPDHHTVVTEGDRVVCLKLRWIGRALLDGAELVTDTGADFAARPEYQGRGLGRLLTDFEINGARPRGHLAMDLPPSNAVVRDHLHAHEIHRRPLTVWTRPLTVRALLAAHRAQPVRLARSMVAAAARRLRRPPASASIAVEPLKSFDERAEALWAAARPSADFVRVRDASYLNWRYADRRSGRRVVLGATEGDQLLGWLVLRPSRPAARLLDILVGPARPEAGIALLTEATRRARSLGASSVSGWFSTDSSYAPLLEAAGFVAASDPVLFEFFEPRGGTGSPDRMRRLGEPALTTHVTMGDFDFN